MYRGHPARTEFTLQRVHKTAASYTPGVPRALASATRYPVLSSVFSWFLTVINEAHRHAESLRR
jgi:hypothetical protein